MKNNYHLYLGKAGHLMIIPFLKRYFSQIS